MTHTPRRIAREDQAAADLEQSMVARSIRPARILTDTVLVLLVALAFVLAVAVYGTTPRADAAKRNVYRGTVTICYAPSTKAPKIDQYLYTQWDLAAAVKAAGPKIGKVRVVKERYPHTTCYGEVSVWSSPEAYANNPKRPYDVYRYGEAGIMWESQITMGDKVGARATAAQRQAWLTAALTAAIPR